MQNAVKPSPWSDFMDLKKGNLYTISKEEKVNQLISEKKNNEFFFFLLIETTL